MRRPVWCRAFLVLLETETNGSIPKAAHRVGIYPAQVYRRRKVDASFDRDVEAVYARLEARYVETCTGRPATSVAGG